MVGHEEPRDGGEQISQGSGMPVVVLSCQVLQDLLARLLPDGVTREVQFLDYGLHRVPAKMTLTLQEKLDGIEEPSLVVLGYGLCGNGLRGLRAGVHTLLVPRVDDCISLLLGSRSAYLREFEAVPGTYYLSKGWLESGSHPLKEYHEYVPKYGEKEAIWIMDQQYQHYERLVMVAHTEEDLEIYRPQALEVAGFCERWGMRYEERLGSDAYVRNLVELVERAAREGTAALNGTSKDFLVIPPGGEIQQEAFMR
ncbi:MAG TPA: DUF1638 domain-containing protein [Anaerolineae bacterium]|nr:DUF1638 domain-containing protein [Anaerolineae bacterium]